MMSMFARRKKPMATSWLDNAPSTSSALAAREQTASDDTKVAALPPVSRSPSIPLEEASRSSPADVRSRLPSVESEASKKTKSSKPKATTSARKKRRRRLAISEESEEDGADYEAHDYAFEDDRSVSGSEGGRRSAQRSASTGPRPARRKRIGDYAEDQSVSSADEQFAKQSMRSRSSSTAGPSGTTPVLRRSRRGSTATVSPTIAMVDDTPLDLESGEMASASLGVPLAASALETSTDTETIAEQPESVASSEESAKHSVPAVASAEGEEQYTQSARSANSKPSAEKLSPTVRAKAATPKKTKGARDGTPKAQRKSGKKGLKTLAVPGRDMSADITDWIASATDGATSHDEAAPSLPNTNTTGGVKRKRGRPPKNKASAAASPAPEPVRSAEADALRERIQGTLNFERELIEAETHPLLIEALKNAASARIEKLDHLKKLRQAKAKQTARIIAAEERQKWVQWENDKRNLWYEMYKKDVRRVNNLVVEVSDNRFTANLCPYIGFELPPPLRPMQHFDLGPAGVAYELPYDDKIASHRTWRLDADEIEQDLLLIGLSKATTDIKNPDHDVTRSPPKLLHTPRDLPEPKIRVLSPSSQAPFYTIPASLSPIKVKAEPPETVKAVPHGDAAKVTKPSGRMAQPALTPRSRNALLYGSVASDVYQGATANAPIVITDSSPVRPALPLPDEPASQQKRRSTTHSEHSSKVHPTTDVNDTQPNAGLHPPSSAYMAASAIPAVGITSDISPTLEHKPASRSEMDRQKRDSQRDTKMPVSADSKACGRLPPYRSDPQDPALVEEKRLNDALAAKRAEQEKKRRDDEAKSMYYPGPGTYNAYFPYSSLYGPAFGGIYPGPLPPSNGYHEIQYSYPSANSMQGSPPILQNNYFPSPHYTTHSPAHTTNNSPSSTFAHKQSPAAIPKHR